MAKKAVATLQTGKTEGRSYTKVIKMVKSPKTVLTSSMNKWFRMIRFKTFSRNNQSHYKTSESSFQITGRNFFLCFFVDVKD